MIIRLFAAGSAMIAVAGMFLPTEARSHGYRYPSGAGYRTEIARGRAGVTITTRPTFYDGGFRAVLFKAPPNACDRMGLVGFESASGADRGRCYPDGAGIR